MNIELKAIDKTNYEACTNLKVAKGQEDFVAPNWWSLVEAAYEPEMFPLAIYADGAMVGFILYDFDYTLGGWSMSRFMIGEKHQGQGIGKAALAKFIELFKNKHGARPLYTSVDVNNPRVMALYESFGFAAGEVFEYTILSGKTYKERRMVLNL